MTDTKIELERTEGLAGKFVPRGSYLLVSVAAERKTASPTSSIIVPDTSRGRNFRNGTILRLGDEARSAGLKEGDVVVFAREHVDYGTEKLVHYLLSNEGAGEYHILKWFDAVGVLSANEDGSFPEIT